MQMFLMPLPLSSGSSGSGKRPADVLGGDGDDEGDLGPKPKSKRQKKAEAKAKAQAKRAAQAPAASAEASAPAFEAGPREGRKATTVPKAAHLAKKYKGRSQATHVIGLADAEFATACGYQVVVSWLPWAADDCT